MYGYNPFTPESAIRAFQSIKRDLFDRICHDKVLREAGHLFLDKQTDFAIMLVSNTVSILRHNVECCQKIWFPESTQRKPTVTEASVTE